MRVNTKNIQRVVITAWDGYIKVITPNMNYVFEGMGLVPNNVREWIKENSNKVKTIESFGL